MALSFLFVNKCFTRYTFREKFFKYISDEIGSVAERHHLYSSDLFQENKHYKEKTQASDTGLTSN